MIKAEELRMGNTVLYKAAGRIRPVPLDAALFAQLLQDAADFFPVVLKGEHFEKAGFTENKDYALLPTAHEYIRVLAVPGSAHIELRGYTKTNGESFARALVNNAPASRNVFHLHALENLYHALTGEALQ
jgi:hypothetical protein